MSLDAVWLLVIVSWTSHCPVGPRVGVASAVQSSLVPPLVAPVFVSWNEIFVCLSWFDVGAATDKDGSFVQASGVAAEALTNIRTIASLGLQKTLINNFNAVLALGSEAAAKYESRPPATRLPFLAILHALFLIFTHAVVFVLDHCHTRAVSCVSAVCLHPTHHPRS